MVIGGAQARIAYIGIKPEAVADHGIPC